MAEKEEKDRKKKRDGWILRLCKGLLVYAQGMWKIETSEGQ